MLIFLNPDNFGLYFVGVFPDLPEHYLPGGHLFIKSEKEIRKMNEKIQRKTPEPVLYGLFFGNGKFLTSAEIRTMQSLGVIPQQKYQLKK